MSASYQSQSAIGNARSNTTQDSLPDVRWLLGLLAAMAVALLLRLHCLRFTYLFLDESATIWSISGGSYGEMLRRALHWTASGPLFLLCYRLSCDLVGNVVLGVKLPGIICGTIGVWAVWWSCR